MDPNALMLNAKLFNPTPPQKKINSFQHLDSKDAL